MHELFTDLKLLVLDTLFPVCCLVCQKDNELLCMSCLLNLGKVTNQRCLICGGASSFGLSHLRCQSPHRPKALVSLFDYHDANVANLIISGKYKFLPDVFNILSSELANTLHSTYTPFLENAVLIPLPLHAARQRWRGFNQAEVIVNSLGQKLNLPVQKVLARTRATKTQKDLKGQERQENVSGAFVLTKGADIKARNLILVDDVTTTGATLLEAVKVLKRNGARDVICITLAQD